MEPQFQLFGMVLWIRVVENNSRGCPKKECNKYSNLVLIYHSDGTFAEYAHLKKDGALVNEGDKVSIGQKIALSGSTGYSTGPHLHLEVFLPKPYGRNSVKTKFLVKKGKKKKYLKASKTYSKKY